MAPPKKTHDPAKRCRKCKESKQQCGRCAGTADRHAARKRRQRDERSSRVPDPLLEGNRKCHRESQRQARAAAKAYNFILNADMCKGVDVQTGKPCTRKSQTGCSIDGSPRCRMCYKAAVGAADYKALLRERLDALPKCVGTYKGRACKSRTGDGRGLLAALRRTGVTSAEAREAVKTEDCIRRLVGHYDDSKLCVRCFKREHRDLGEQLKNLTMCNDDAGSCKRIAFHHGLCNHHYGLSLPASSTLCAGEDGDFSCESGQPRKQSTGNLCKTCFAAMTGRMAVQGPPARPPKRRRRE